MKRRLVSGWLLIGLASLLLVGHVLADEIPLGPADVVLQTEAAKKPARFPHRKHQETIPCGSCHHQKGEVLMAEKCGSCHGDNAGESEVLTFKKVAHMLCKDCHREVIEKGAQVPIKCGDCHLKKQD